MGNKVINTVIFEPNQEVATVKNDMWQWDKGQVLEIKGLNLNKYVQINFALEHYGVSIPAIGITENGVTKVDIPKDIFEAYTQRDYVAHAYVFQEDNNSGETTHKIIIPIKARPMPNDYVSELDVSALSKAIDMLNDNNKLAESFAHGGTGQRVGEETDNAKYWSDEAKKLTLDATSKVDAVNSTVDKAKVDINKTASIAKSDINKTAQTAKNDINVKVTEVNNTAKTVTAKATEVSNNANKVAQDKASVNTMKNDVTAKATQVTKDKETVAQLKTEVEQGIQENMQYVGFWYN